MTRILRNIPFSPPDMTEAEANEVREAILSGWITTGPRVKEFEQKISEYVGTEKTVCLNSATAAMEMALHMLGVGPGDEVIVPAYTYTATASVVLHVGATPVFVDIQDPAKNSGSVEMDYDKLSDAITERTKVIAPVDLAGIVADLDRVFAIVEAKKSLFRPKNEIQKRFGRIIVSSDCAHSFGAWRRVKTCGNPVPASAEGAKAMAGAIADFSSFSFHAVKNLTTAEGGALTWNLPFGGEKVVVDAGTTVPAIEGETWNEYLYRLAQLYSLHGQNKDALAKTKLGAWEYDVIGPWYKCNMTDIMAGLGLAQFKRYQGMLERRKEIIGRYDAAFKPLGILPLEHYGADWAGSGHLYICRIPGYSREQTNEVITKMEERGIACNVHYKPLPMMTAYKALGYRIEDFPNAYRFFENEITLPLHTRLSDEDVAYVIENFVEVVTGKSYVPQTFVSGSIRPSDRIFLCLAHMSEAGVEQKYIKKAFDDNYVVPLGPNVNQFEKTLEHFVNESESGKRIVALSCGTAAVHLALINCGVQAGDEVLVQSFTFCASSHPVTYLGAKPVFVGSELGTWNMDPELLEEAILDRKAKTGRYPKAIIPVALYGMPYRIDRIMAIADKYGIPVIEDTAEGLGSKFHGRTLGTFGKFGVLSFNGNKMITTSGGGALITGDDQQWLEVMRYATQYREGYPYYQHEKIGYNYRMSNICAGIGIGQMTVLEDHIAHHRHVAGLYEKAFADIPGITFHKGPDWAAEGSNYWLNTITIDPSLHVKGQEDAYASIVTGAVGGAAGVVHAASSAHTDCEPNANVEAMRVFLDKAGIEARPLWKPMHKQPVYADAPVYTREVETELFKLGLCLPSGPCVSDDDVRYIVEKIRESILG